MNRHRRYGKDLDLALSTWVKLARASALFGKRTGDHIRGSGLTVAQFGAMETLHHRGPLTPGELCAKQLVSGGNMTVVLDNLEREGLIRRIPSSIDRRSTTVHLTHRGEAMMERIFPEHARVVGELISVLSHDELLRLGALLRKLGFSLREGAHRDNHGGAAPHLSEGETRDQRTYFSNRRKRKTES